MSPDFRIWIYGHHHPVTPTDSHAVTLVRVMRMLGRLCDPKRIALIEGEVLPEAFERLYPGMSIDPDVPLPDGRIRTEQWWVDATLAIDATGKGYRPKTILQQVMWRHNDERDTFLMHEIADYYQQGYSVASSWGSLHADALDSRLRKLEGMPGGDWLRATGEREIAQLLTNCAQRFLHAER